MEGAPKEITIYPSALFEIIKDIQMGYNSGQAEGFIYGMSSNPIEVTVAVPGYSSKEKNSTERIEYMESKKNFQRKYFCCI